MTIGHQVSRAIVTVGLAAFAVFCSGAGASAAHRHHYSSHQGLAHPIRDRAPSFASSGPGAMPIYQYDVGARVRADRYGGDGRPVVRIMVRTWHPRLRRVIEASAPSAPAREPVVPQDTGAAALGALLDIPGGWADGMATAISHAVGGCGVSFRHNLVDCKSGASTSVSSTMLPHAQCLLRWLDAMGYPVRDIGGYGERGNPSAHPTGNALDVNQLGRNVVSVRFPSGVTSAAERCGLVHGAVWSNPDQGHFELPNKFGYVFPSRYRYALRRRVHYAYRRRVHYAGR